MQNDKLNTIISKHMLRRDKSLIADQLPGKKDNVVFCPLTQLQKAVYRRLLAMDEFEGTVPSLSPLSLSLSVCPQLTQVPWTNSKGFDRAGGTCRRALCGTFSTRQTQRLVCRSRAANAQTSACSCLP